LSIKNFDLRMLRILDDNPQGSNDPQDHILNKHSENIKLLFENPQDPR